MRMRSTHWRVTEGNKQTASCGYLNANTGLRHLIFIWFPTEKDIMRNSRTHLCTQNLFRLSIPDTGSNMSQKLIWNIWTIDQFQFKFLKVVWLSTKGNQYWHAHLMGKSLTQVAASHLAYLRLNVQRQSFSYFLWMLIQSDPSFCCDSIDGKCKLKVAHPYYAQVQGQMGITGADWCDFVIFTKKGMSIEGVPFDPEYWQELEVSCCFIIIHISLNML